MCGSIRPSQGKISIGVLDEHTVKQDAVVHTGRWMRRSAVTSRDLDERNKNRSSPDEVTCSSHIGIEF